MNIAIDSNTFIWGIKETASPSQLINIQHAKNFFNYCVEQKFHVIIPSIVVAEILVIESESKRVEYLKKIGESFKVASFDTLCATIYARILKEKLEENKALVKNLDIRREKMKLDQLIVATALANKCKFIVSDDSDVHAFAKGSIEVRRIASFITPTQNSLFDEL